MPIGITDMEFAAARNMRAAEAERDEYHEEFWKMVWRKRNSDSHAAALMACLDAFRTMHPDSPLLKETGLILEDGSAQTVLNAEHYEPAFDKKAISLGQETPTNWRHVAMTPEEYARRERKAEEARIAEANRPKKRGLIARMFG